MKWDPYCVQTFLHVALVLPMSAGVDLVPPACKRTPAAQDAVRPRPRRGGLRQQSSAAPVVAHSAFLACKPSFVPSSRLLCVMFPAAGGRLAAPRRSLKAHGLACGRVGVWADGWHAALPTRGALAPERAHALQGEAQERGELQYGADGQHLQASLTFKSVCSLLFTSSCRAKYVARL